MFDPTRLKAWKIPQIEQSYTQRDVFLYATGLGLAAQGIDDESLGFFYERGAKALPGFALTLGYPGAWMSDPATGVNFVKLLHTEQRLRLHQNLPISGRVRSTTRVTRVVDKGADKGALMIQERQIHLLDEQGQVQTHGLLATNEQVLYLRGNGGFSAQGLPSDTAPEPLPTIPSTAPTHHVQWDTRSDLALVYRLVSGDMNPLHGDPQVAQKAGFERPILHGLGTYGIAAYVILRECCAGNPAAFKGIDARFTQVVYPGETLLISLWQEAGRVLFRVQVKERGVTALDNGVAYLAA